MTTPEETTSPKPCELEPIISDRLILSRRTYSDLFHNFVEGRYEKGGLEAFLDDLWTGILASRSKITFAPPSKLKPIAIRELIQPELYMSFPLLKKYVRNIQPLEPHSGNPKLSSRAIREAKDNASVKIGKHKEAFAFPRQKKMILQRLQDRSNHLLEKEPCSEQDLILADWFLAREGECKANKYDPSPCLAATANKWSRQILYGSLPENVPYRLETFIHLIHHSIFVRGVHPLHQETRLVGLKPIQEAPEQRQLEHIPPVYEKNLLESLFESEETVRVFLLWCLYRDFVFHHIDLFQLRLIGPKRWEERNPHLFAKTIQPRYWYAPLIRSLLAGESGPSDDGLHHVQKILDQWHAEHRVHSKWYQAWRKYRSLIFRKVWTDLRSIVHALLTTPKLQIQSMYDRFRKSRKVDMPKFHLIRRDTHFQGFTEAERDVLCFGDLLLLPFPWSSQPRSTTRGQSGGVPSVAFDEALRRHDQHLARHVLRMGIRENSILEALKITPQAHLKDLVLRYPVVFESLAHQATARVRAWLAEQPSAVSEYQARTIFIGFVQRFLLQVMKGDVTANATERQNALWNFLVDTALHDRILTMDSEQLRYVFLLSDNPRVPITLNFQTWNGIDPTLEALSPQERVRKLRTLWKGYILHPDVETFLVRYMTEAAFDADGWKPLICLPVREQANAPSWSAAEVVLHALFGMLRVHKHLLLNTTKVDAPLVQLLTQYMQLATASLVQKQMFLETSLLPPIPAADRTHPDRLLKALLDPAFAGSTLLAEEVGLWDEARPTPFACLWIPAGKEPQWELVAPYLYRLRYELGTLANNEWYILDAVTASDGCQHGTASDRTPQWMVYERTHTTADWEQTMDTLLASFARTQSADKVAAPLLALGTKLHFNHLFLQRWFRFRDRTPTLPPVDLFEEAIQNHLVKALMGEFRARTPPLELKQWKQEVLPRIRVFTEDLARLHPLQLTPAIQNLALAFVGDARTHKLPVLRRFLQAVVQRALDQSDPEFLKAFLETVRPLSAYFRELKTMVEDHEAVQKGKRVRPPSTVT